MINRIAENQVNFHSEFEIQSEAYQILKKWWPYTVRGEYETHNKSCRFDIVLLNSEEQIFLIIEVKRKLGLKGRLSQKWRYERITGRPVMHITGMEEAKNCIALIKEFVKERQLS